MIENEKRLVFMCKIGYNMKSKHDENDKWVKNLLKRGKQML